MSLPPSVYHTCVAPTAETAAPRLSAPFCAQPHAVVPPTAVLLTVTSVRLCLESMLWNALNLHAEPPHESP